MRPGTVHLFSGINEENFLAEFMSAEDGSGAWCVLVIANPKYHEFGGNIEMAEWTLLPVFKQAVADCNPGWTISGPARFPAGLSCFPGEQAVISGSVSGFLSRPGAFTPVSRDFSVPAQGATLPVRRGMGKTPPAVYADKLLQSGIPRPAEKQWYFHVFKVYKPCFRDILRRRLLRKGSSSGRMKGAARMSQYDPQQGRKRPGSDPYQGYSQTYYQQGQTGQNAPVNGFQQGQAGQSGQMPYPGGYGQQGAYPPYGQQYSRGYGQQNPYGQQQNPYAQQNPYGQQQPPYPQQGYGNVPQGAQNVPQQNYPSGAYSQVYGQRQGGYAQQNGQINSVYPPQQPPQTGFGGYPVGQGGQSEGTMGGRARSMDPHALLRVILPAAVLILFVVSLLLPGVPAMKYITLGAGAVSIALIFLLSLYEGSMRTTVCILLAAMIAFTGVSLALPQQRGDSAVRRAEDRNQGQETGGEPDGGDSMVVEVPPQETPPPPSPTPEDVAGSQLMEMLQSFLYFWTVGNLDNMVGCCAPSWVRAQESAQTSLFQILANRTLEEYVPGSPSGTPDDMSRTVEVTAKVNKNNMQASETYRFRVVMLKENETWYVDPRSLQSHEEVEATAFSAEITQPPTPQPASASQVLYYNPDGGSYYHADPNCTLVGEKYRPLKGSFTYAQINDAAYAKLNPCSGCAAPLRAR